MASNLRVDTILPSTGTSLGIGTASGTTTVTGTLNAASATITGNLGVGGVLTYEDVTNVDSVGLITARNGLKIGPTAGVAGTFFADGSYITAGILTATTGSFSGTVTANSFSGDGSSLTGIDATAIQTGNTVVQTNASRIDSKVSNVGILTVTSAGINVTGVVTATSFVGSGANLTGIQGIPSGVIMMWSGNIASIPSGFVLCNGSNSTPDLRDRFIVGAKQDDSGTAMSNITGSLASTGGNTSFTTSQEGAHENTGTEDNSAQIQDASSSYNGIQNKNSRDRHQHGIDWRHTHTVTAIPSFYALAYIMKS